MPIFCSAISAGVTTGVGIDLKDETMFVTIDGHSLGELLPLLHCNYIHSGLVP